MTMQGWTLSHQKVCFDIDFESQSLKGITELRIKPTGRLIKSLRFNLRQCVVTRAYVDGVEAEHSCTDHTIAVSPDPEGTKRGPKHHQASEYRDFYGQQQDRADRGELSITPRDPVDPNSALVLVVVEFELTDPLGGIHFVTPHDGCYNDRPTHMYTSAGICETRLFMPCVDIFGEDINGDEDVGRLSPQYPTWDLQFTVPAGMVAVSSGTLQKQMELPDGRGFFRYALDVQTNASGIGFAVGPFTVFPDEKSQGTTHFCLPAMDANLRHTVRVYPYVEEFFEGLLKSTIPYNSHQLVFVDECVEPLLTYAGLTILSASILSSERIIDHTFDVTRKTIARARAMQYFSHAIAPKSRLETWIIFGIVGYLTGLFLEYTFGMNEYRSYVQKELTWVMEHDHNRREPLSSDRHTHAIEHCSEFVQRKAFIIMRMMEKLVTKECLLEIFLKIIEGGGSGQVEEDEGSTEVILVCADTFRALLEDAAPKKAVKQFYESWVERSGYAHIRVKFSWAEKTNEVKLVITQPDYDYFQGDLHVGIQDIESYKSGTSQRITGPHEERTVQLESRLKRNKKDRQKKKKVQLATDSNFDIDLTDKDTNIDWTALWIAVDPDFEWYRKVTITQDTQMWIFAARYERRITEQLQAIWHLSTLAEEKVFKALARVATHGKKVKKGLMFWRVRCEAFRALSKLVANGKLLKLSLFVIHEFKEMFGVPKHPEVIGQNDFDNFEEYFIQRSMVGTIAAIREEVGDNGGQSPEKSYHFVKDLIEMNDNSENLYDDNNYIGDLLKAFATTVNIDTGDFSTVEQLQQHHTRLREVLDTIARVMNLDKLKPSFHQNITCSGLEAILALMSEFVMPLQTTLFKEHSLYGHFEQVRDVALASIAKLLVDGDMTDMAFLLEIAENDHAPATRARVLAHCAAASPYTELKGGMDVAAIHAIMARVWKLMNANTAFDIRSRFNALSFFETILPPVKTKRTTGSIAKFSLGGNKGSSIKIGLNLKKNMS